MSSSQDPRHVLKHLNEELGAVLLGERLIDGGEPYGVYLTAKQARAIRELYKSYTQASKTTMMDRLKSLVNILPPEEK